MRQAWRSRRLVAVAAGAFVWVAVPLSGAALHGAGAPGRTAALALGLARPALAMPAEIVEQRPPVRPGSRRHVVRWRAAGLLREVVEVTPIAPTRPLPLVVVLHGRRQTPWRAERVEGWDRYAAAGQALIAYGAGYGGSWNAGGCCGVATRDRVDDIRFVLTTIRLEEQRHAVDRSRVFVVGFSNGGMLAYAFACAHADVISAFAVVAGSLETRTCRPSRPLSVLDVQGDRDRIVPFAGSLFSRVAGSPISSVARSLRPWQRIATGSADVQLLRLRGLGHEWPTLVRGQWDATSGIWHFLLTHPAATS